MLFDNFLYNLRMHKPGTGFVQQQLCLLIGRVPSPQPFFPQKNINNLIEIMGFDIGQRQGLI